MGSLSRAGVWLVGVAVVGTLVNWSLWVVGSSVVDPFWAAPGSVGCLVSGLEPSWTGGAGLSKGQRVILRAGWGLVHKRSGLLSYLAAWTQSSVR